MNITLLLTGKTDRDFIDRGIGLYEGRLRHYVNFNIVYLPDIKKKLPEKQHTAEEGKNLLKILEPSDILVLFDERGKEYSSPQLAGFIEKYMIAGTRRLIFAVGGPYGFSGEVYKRANRKISISKMTFPHQLIRLPVIEQIYRAFTIIKGEPYHHA